MLDNYKTSELLDLINSLIREGKVEEFRFLYDSALDELGLRHPIMADLYIYRELFDSDFN